MTPNGPLQPRSPTSWQGMSQDPHPAPLPPATLTAEFLLFPHLLPLPPGSPVSRSSTSHLVGDITNLLSFPIPPIPNQSCGLSRFSLVPQVPC